MREERERGENTSPRGSQERLLLLAPLGGGDRESSLEKLESLLKLADRLRLGGERESSGRLLAGGGGRERDREGETDLGRPFGGGRLMVTPGGGDLDFILVSTGVLDRAR
jgi:hypothetical protein